MLPVMRVRLEHRGGWIVLVPWYQAAFEAELDPPLTSLTAAHLRASIANSGAVRSSLRALLLELGEPEASDDNELAIRIAAAIDRGRVRVELELHEPMISTAAPDSSAPEHTVEPTTLDEHQPDWIEIELIGEDDQGIAGARCVLTLADGRTLTRTTDRFGLIRVDGVAPGECSISFPELDQEAWELA